MPFSALRYSHEWLSHFRPPPGATAAVDATVGNGHDTLFLAQWLGPAGTVHGFDVQEVALAAARHRCENHPGRLATIRWHHCGHEHAAEVLCQEQASPLAAVMFNLGYHPGGDKSLITRAETTLPALRDLSARLAPGGVMTITAYPGHPGGQEETAAVVAWAASVEVKQFQVAHHRLLNQGPRPELITLERLA